MNTLHTQTLKSLIAIQYFMSTLSSLSDTGLRNQYYIQSLETMKDVVETLIATTEKPLLQNQDYPEELVLVIKDLANINSKIYDLKTLN